MPSRALTVSVIRHRARGRQRFNALNRKTFLFEIKFEIKLKQKRQQKYRKLIKNN
jgi:hypothetical protein